MLHSQNEILLVSACLTGLCTRYDGKSKPSPACLEYLTGCRWIPVCPEQLGGLSTPRTPADIVGGDGHDVLAGRATVIDRDGNDVTAQFIRGAHQTLSIAQHQQVSTALLKARSPSCGVTIMGVTAALLSENGVQVIEY